jgi:hypothetical protein
VKDFRFDRTFFLYVLVLVFFLANLIKYRLHFENQCLEHLSIDAQSLKSSILWIEQEQNYQIQIPYQYTADFALNHLRVLIHRSHELKEIGTLSIQAKSKGFIEISIYEEHLQKGMLWQLIIEPLSLFGFLTKFKSFPLWIPFLVIPKQNTHFHLPSQLLVQHLHQLQNQAKQRQIPKSKLIGHDEFKELRDYQQGDALSKIAWPLLAKRQKLIVKTYEDAFDLKAMLLIDISGQMKQSIFGDCPIDIAIKESWQQSKTLYQNDLFSEIYLAAFSHSAFKVDLMRKQNSFLQALIHLKNRYDQAFLPLENSYLQDQVTLFLYTTQQIEINDQSLLQQVDANQQVDADLPTIISKDTLIEDLIKLGWLEENERDLMQTTDEWNQKLREICFQNCIALDNAWDIDIESQVAPQTIKLIESLDWAMKKGIHVVLLFVYLSLVSDQLIKKVAEAKRKGIRVIWVQMVTAYEMGQQKGTESKRDQTMMNQLKKNCEFYQIRLF